MTEPYLYPISDALDEESKIDKRDDAIEAKALELRGDWHMRLWYDGTGWTWTLDDSQDDRLESEVCRTESEAWTGLREAVDRCSRKQAEAWMKREEEAIRKGYYEG